MARLLVLIIIINNLVGKGLTDKDTKMKTTNNVSEDFDIDQEIKEYCTVIENFSIYL